MNVNLTQAEVEYLKALVDEDAAHYQDNLKAEDDRRNAIFALTLANKLEGQTPEAAEVAARRQVDAWWDEAQAPGGG